MKHRILLACLFLLSVPIASAQMYTLIDLGSFGLPTYFGALNNSGQVAGTWICSSQGFGCPFRTGPNTPINPDTDPLGSLGGTYGQAYGLNDSGQAVGYSFLNSYPFDFAYHAFRTAPNAAINPATDDLGTLSGYQSIAYGINASGQVVGYAAVNNGASWHAFRTAPNAPINAATDDLGTLGGGLSVAYGINASGQAFGDGDLKDNTTYHAFRTAPNASINAATDDLGTLGGTEASAVAMNASGQVVGQSALTNGIAWHAFRTAGNAAINPATDDLGTLGTGTSSQASAIDDFGQAVGWSSTSGDTFTSYHAFLYTGGVMFDLNSLISPGFGDILFLATGINNAGQITATDAGLQRILLLDPIYEAFVQQPINADGSSIFKANRGVIPVKFALTQYKVSTCDLLPATIAITRAIGNTLVSVDETIYATPADSGSDFRIDSTACQYVYNLAASALGVGMYRVDISINGIFVGHGVFALK